MSRREERKWAKSELNKVLENKENTFLIHYSCTGFNKNVKEPSRVTGIAISNLRTGQTYNCGPVKSLTKTEEKKVLKNFYDFVAEHQNAYWVHWNMRDINFGFQALEHRYKELNGKGPKKIIHELRRVDLARVVYGLYSKEYINGDDKFIQLLNLNKFKKSQLLKGSKEAEKTDDKEFMAVYRSTLSKLEGFSYIITRIEEGGLKHKSTFFQVYGLNLETFKVLIGWGSAVYTGLQVIVSVISWAQKFSSLVV